MYKGFPVGYLLFWSTGADLEPARTGSPTSRPFLHYSSSSVTNERHGLVHRQGFTDDLLAFDAPSIKQILDKCTMLQESPEQGGKAKAQVPAATTASTGCERASSGSSTPTTIRRSVCGAVRRKTVKGQYRGKKGGDVTYDGISEVEDDDLDLDPEAIAAPQLRDWMAPELEVVPLPEPITAELLDALGVDRRFHARLIDITDQDALLDCPGVPAEQLLAIDRHMFEEPISLRAEQPELYAPGGVDDLLRFVNGELVGFLLRLNVEQERFVTWASTASGPTLVKGGPGTGKSTVAIYRTRQMISILREAGIEDPTDSLHDVHQRARSPSRSSCSDRSSEKTQHAWTSERPTASSAPCWASAATRARDRARRSVRPAELLRWPRLDQAGNALQRAAQQRIVERLGRTYLFEEIETVIQARGLNSVEQYLDAPRPGRRIPLTESQRRGVWAVAIAYADCAGRRRLPDLAASAIHSGQACGRRRSWRPDVRRRDRG